MNVDAQIRVLIENAPQDGTTPRIIQTIAPVLKAIAGQLSHAQYYILQTLNQDWVLTTLSNRAQPDREKKAIYAFSTLEDAKASVRTPLNPNLVAVALPVTHILFQMVALENVDSTIFFDIPGNGDKGTEVKRSDLQRLIQIQLQQKLGATGSRIPPNMA
ncbi:hypothetical protein IQ235_11380 [Oscillatoriales cyanobacterium LEGE 11467]|uniref:Uncharacterized protein n=1 Tax=Zarconia navalis LEGE 11467 TaxID=1828826 RepID=A0A928W022_9CYAN|nr:hypothetical protein [Zarconia navalis]MBE9041383.1 hypothetical protein [Zarconia navalis LEGE 11467]